MGEVKRRIIIPLVEEDRLWKDHIRGIMTNQLFIWPSKWSFLVDEYKKLDEALEGKRAISPYEWKRDIARKSASREYKKMEPAKLYLPPIRQKYAKQNVPRTTNGWYGHLHKVDGHNLVWDRQQWTKADAAQHDLVKLLGWPTDYYD